MRKAAVLTVLILCTCSPRSFGDPPRPHLEIHDPFAKEERWGLKLDTLGESLGTFKVRHLRPASGKDHAPFCSDEKPSGAVVKTDVHGVVNCTLDLPYETLDYGYKPPTVAEIPTLHPKHSPYGYGLIYRFLDSQLWRIEAVVDTSSYQRLRAAAEAKWGQPAEVSTEEVKNKMGATFQAEVVRWARGNDRVELRQASGSLDTAKIVIFDAMLDSEALKREKEHAAKAARDM